VSEPGAPAALPLLRLSGITKRFGALVANRDITLEVHAGEVLALLGENGAGKSTLVSILFGHYLADEGRVEVDGRPLPPGQPRAALAAGIGMVHQHFTLAGHLTVLDNVMLGTEPLWRPASARAAARAKLLELARRFGLAVQPEARVASLSVGERQRVEILKALYRGARLLILDEPTAVLTPAESAALFATLGRMVGEGLAVVFISHRLDEVLAVAHRIAVLRGGALVADAPNPLHGVEAGAAEQAAARAQLAETMVGRDVAPPRRRPAPRGDAVVVLRGVSARRALAGGLGGGVAPPAIADIHLDVHAGEVLAIAGVSGNGQAVLAALLAGLEAPTAGTLTVAGATLPPRPAAWVRAGVARIPEDRHHEGAVASLPIWANTALEAFTRPPFARFGALRRRRLLDHAAGIVRAFGVRGTEARGVHTTAGALSGGNLQKLILGRALTPLPAVSSASPRAASSPPPPRFILADQPTWGLDVGAVADIHQRLLDAAAAGSAVLLISEDLDEVFALADRVTVMRGGRLGPARPAAAWTLREIGLAMGGAGEAPGGASPAPAAAHDVAPRTPA
jgi:simple sugar transport system ATP-binding protein